MNVGVIRYNKKAILQYLYLYISIQFIGGRLATALGSDLFIGGSLFLSGMYLVKYFPRVKRESNYFTVLIFMGVFLTITIVMTRGGLSIATSLSLISRFLIVYCAIDIDRERFVERLLRLTAAFAITSIIIFAFVQIGGHNLAKTIFSNLYEIKSGKSWIDSSYGLLFICYNFMNANRNSYMFGEPGEYQMLIMLALYYLTFWKNSFTEKTKRNMFILYIVTMLTIQSTTGFFNLIVFFVCIIFSRSSKVDDKIKKTVLIILIVFFLYLMFFAGDTSFIYQQLDKITTSQGNIDLGATTGGDRVDSILSLISIAVSSPSSLIFGVGYGGIVALRGGFSCSGIVNTIIMLGIFTCTLLYGWINYCVIKFSKNIFEIIFLLFMIINNGLSQPDLLAITTVIVAASNYLCRSKIK